MKCLTVRQPWAWMIIHGGGFFEPLIDGNIQPGIRYGFKNVENRKWKTQYRGALLIHAAKAEIDEDDDYWIAMKMYYEANRDSPGRTRQLPDYCAYGAIIGRVNLVDIIRDSPSRWAFPDHWHWELDNPEPIQPIKYRGMPGLFNVPDDLFDAQCGPCYCPEHTGLFDVDISRGKER